MYRTIANVVRPRRAILSAPRPGVGAASRLLACIALALLVSACSKRGPENNTPVTPAAPATPAQFPATAPANARSTDASVPPADSVVMPAGNAPRADATAGRANAAMTRREESSAMPMPGQNNDHSAPLAPAKRASGP